MERLETLIILAILNISSSLQTRTCTDADTIGGREEGGREGGVITMKNADQQISRLKT